MAAAVTAAASYTTRRDMTFALERMPRLIC